MTPCLFAGPSLHGVTAPSGVDIFEPAMLGSVFQAVKAGYKCVGLLDGYFGNTPAVWHKEILYAMANGVEIFGASSIGALRAAELHHYGMHGVGKIFRLFRGGILTDDDEVCVIHSVKELQFAPLSEPMVNLRYTFRYMRRRGLIGAELEKHLTLEMKSRHFSQRTRETLAEVVRSRLGSSKVGGVMTAFEDNYADIKMEDALSLISLLCKSRLPMAASTSWSFPRTGHWKVQFERDIAQLPALESWR